MLDTSYQYNLLPTTPGVGYKPQHFADIMTDPGCVTWIEIHAENYMGAGGRPIAQLQALSDCFGISVHGVGLSIGGESPLNSEHLSRLKNLLGWLNPASFSEHLAWSTHDSTFLNDLLPLPYTNATLRRVVEHIDQVQHLLGRRMLLENPSNYLAFTESTWSEIEFLDEVCKRSGCGLLFDVNNVFVSAINMNYSPQDYIHHFPHSQVGEIHIGGHNQDKDEYGQLLLIDSHQCEVVDPVWELLNDTLKKTGPKPVLVEWDTNVPEWSVLKSEARKIEQVMVTALA
ncbi:MAG: DUF692 domain-containing protein [Aestuariivita sp.]|nr:DUF692 domain-containing protein [Aestuariivita sp.]